MIRSGFGLAVACGAAALTAFANAPALAQNTPRPDPLNSKAEVSALQYEPAFKGYRKFEDQPVTSWRGANDLVNKLGGWKAFASDQVPDVPDSPDGVSGARKPAQEQPAASSAGHAGHKAP